ncbi:ABC transporter ATP-binding protein [Mesorhizobium koreense]|jgi:branched-chain amino acid transport system ATP-binding protein|uniref:ABC transporter ATP-binding protein n=1 Tax=Mesorhizobium koreense TaxID=3074855 RepID=UPI00287B7701|nr:ABC transporter ATP-binding protein [Mesorhizobium sp. WR6]
MSAVEVKDLRRSFGGIKAVAGVSFEVEPAEIVGIIGPNGSGKSTLFSLLSGTIAPTSGVIKLRGHDVTRMPAYRIARLGLGRTFQIPTPFTNMTVRENLLAAAVEGDWANARSRADEVLEALEITHVADDLAGTLSGGQLRLLEFGRVQMRDAEIILLDEVTAGVNPRLRQIILARVRALQEKGKTFLIIEHDMELVRSVCERIIVMDAGEIVFEGSFEEVASNEVVIDAYLGRPAA